MITCLLTLEDGRIEWRISRIPYLSASLEKTSADDCVVAEDESITEVWREVNQVLMKPSVL